MSWFTYLWSDNTNSIEEPIQDQSSKQINDNPPTAQIMTDDASLDQTVIDSIQEWEILNGKDINSQSKTPTVDQSEPSIENESECAESSDNNINLENEDHSMEQIPNQPPTPPPRRPKDNNIYTTNGALSYAVNNSYINLFFKGNRDSDEDMLWENIKSIMLDNPVRASKLLFYIRDRMAKGQRKPFVLFYRYLIANSSENPSYHKFIINSIPHIADFGYWKDLLKIFANTKYERTMINIYCRQLRLDEFYMNQGMPISLAAKYIPAEKHEYDKRFKLASKFQNELAISTRKEYRQYRTKFLAYLDVLEQKLCTHQWNDIEFSHIPSRAMQMYRNAFSENVYLRERFLDYLDNVRTGREKMNTSHASPAELIYKYTLNGMVSTYMSENMWSFQLFTEDPILEATWSQMLSDIRKLRNNDDSINILPICDISGSMRAPVCGGNVKCIDVSYAITLLLSLSNPSQEYNGRYYTFTEKPTYGKIKGETLKDQLSSIYGNNNSSTDFEAVFDDILTRAVHNEVSQDQIPKYLLVVSDMQFNKARGDSLTNWTSIQEKYKDYGYKRPTIIFYNVGSKHLDFPVCEDVPDTALINGFDTKVLECLYDGNIPDPLGLMNKAIGVDRYSPVEDWW